MNLSEREIRLARLYDRWAANVHAYARRHCGQDGADDVLAETFLVAVRRIEDVPADELPWLLVVARNVIANQRRSTRRRDNLHAVVLGQPMATQSAAEEVAAERLEMLRAMRELTEVEREALLLVAWDGLGIAQAAQVAGCRERAFRARLGRARRRLAAELGEVPPDRPALAAVIRTEEGI